MRVVSGVLLTALSMTPVLPGAAKETPAVIGNWELIEDGDREDKMCVLIGRAAPTTWLLVRMNASEARRESVSLMFSDTGWSIKAKDDLGTMRLSTARRTLTGVPDTADSSFLLTARFDEVVRLFQTADRDGVALERNFEAIAHFAAGNMASKLPELRACGAKLARSDPFAR